MATTFKWVAPEALSTILTSGTLSGLAASSYSGVSTAIPNEADLFQYMALQLVLSSQASARGGGSHIPVYIVRSGDNGATFANAGDSTIEELLTVFALDTSQSALNLVKAGLPIPPLQFKLEIRNKTTVAFGTGTNTLNYRRYNEQGV